MGGSPVKVALQTSSGQRLQATVPSTITLAELLQRFVAEGSLAASWAVLEASGFAGCSVVYMRSSISGSALLETSLAMMGITGGAVSLRLQLPSVGGTIATAAAAPALPAALPSAASNAMLDVPNSGEQLSSVVTLDAGTSLVSTTLTSSQSTRAIATSTDNPAGVSQIAIATSAEITAAAAALTPSQVSAATTAAIVGLRNLAFDSDASVALLTLLRVLDNVLGRPADPAVRRIRLANATFFARVARFPPAVDVLRAAGFVDVSEADGVDSNGVLQLLPANEDRSRLRNVRTRDTGRPRHAPHL